MSSHFSFLGENVEKRVVKLLNGELVEIELNPFNCSTPENQLKDIARILSATYPELGPAHRIHVTEMVDKESGVDYLICVSPPKVDHVIKVDDTHLILSIRRYEDVLDVTEHFQVSSYPFINKLSLELSLSNTSEEIYEKLFTVIAGISDHVLEMDWVWKNNTDLANLSTYLLGFQSIVKWRCTHPLNLKNFETVAKEWKNLSECFLVFDDSLIFNGWEWMKLLNESNIDTFVILFSLDRPSRFTLRELVWMVRCWHDWQYSMAEYGDNARLVILQRK